MKPVLGLPAACAIAMLAWPAAARANPNILHVALCGGGTVEIPIGNGKHSRGGDHDNGCVMACHAVLSNRKRSG